MNKQPKPNECTCHCHSENQLCQDQSHYNPKTGGCEHCTPPSSPIQTAAQASTDEQVKTMKDAGIDFKKYQLLPLEKLCDVCGKLKHEGTHPTHTSPSPIEEKILAKYRFYKVPSSYVLEALKEIEKGNPENKVEIVVDLKQFISEVIAETYEKGYEDGKETAERMFNN